MCQNLKHKISVKYCDQYAEDKSDNYKYQTHIFGSAIDRIQNILNKYRKININMLYNL